MTNAPIVFLDTETDGLRPDRKVWEVAMVRRDENGDREVVMQVTDVDLSGAELIGLNIGRFHARHHMYCPTGNDTWFRNLRMHPVDSIEVPLGEVPTYFGAEADVAKVVEEWTRGAHIVGAVPNFDTECLAAMLRRHGLCPTWHYHLIDIENLAVGYLHGVAARAVDEAQEWGESPDPALIERQMSLPWKSDDISRAIGVEPPSAEERHTAMGDAKWCQRLYDQITGAAIDKENQ